MPDHRQFLVIDDHPDSRFLLVKTLLRKFPRSAIHECQDGDEAVLIARTKPKLDAIVSHRAAGVDGITLLPLLRRVNRTVPIITVSGVDCSEAALAAGATRFLNFDEWLRIGTVVAESLSPHDPAVMGRIEVTPPRPSPPAR